MSPVVIVAVVALILLEMRSIYTSWRLLGVHVRQARGAVDRLERLLALSKVSTRGFRLLLAVVGAGVGMGAFLPQVAHNRIYGVTVTVYILGMVLLLFGINELEYWLLGLGTTVPALAHRVGIRRGQPVAPEDV